MLMKVVLTAAFMVLLTLVLFQKTRSLEWWEVFSTKMQKGVPLVDIHTEIFGLILFAQVCYWGWVMRHSPAWQKRG
jgi:hypothetical protein